MASSDAVDSMKPELWAEGKNTESWLLFSDGMSSRSRLSRSRVCGVYATSRLGVDVGFGEVGEWVGVGAGEWVGVGVMTLSRWNAPIPRSVFGTLLSGSPQSRLMCWVDLFRRWVQGGSALF